MKQFFPGGPRSYNGKRVFTDEEVFTACLIYEIGGISMKAICRYMGAGKDTFRQWVTHGRAERLGFNFSEAQIRSIKNQSHKCATTSAKRSSEPTRKNMSGTGYRQEQSACADHMVE